MKHLYLRLDTKVFLESNNPKEINKDWIKISSKPTDIKTINGFLWRMHDKFGDNVDISIKEIKQEWQRHIQ